MTGTDFRPRLWPAVLIVVCAAVSVAAAPFLVPRTMPHFIAVIGGPILATILLGVWWLTFSRLSGRDRWLPIAAFCLPALSLYLMVYRGDEMKIAVYLAPSVALLGVLWLVAVRGLPWRTQFYGLIAVFLCGWAAASIVRIDGTNAEMIPDVRLAWMPSPQELFARELAARQAQARPLINSPIVIGPEDWPEFRGPARNGIANSAMRVDWSNRPPAELWRRRVGPGWGSFAIVGERAFTQEQRGNDECVVCYHAATGDEIWERRIPGRFYESIAGEGPRCTPTIHDGRVYAYTAFGVLVCLNALTGEELWHRDIRQDVGAEVPNWGFASSPLVIAGNVLVFAGAAGKAVAAYHLEGELAWAHGNGRHGYSSAQRFVFDGMEYALMVSDYGLEAFDPSSGEPRGEFEWHRKGQNRVAQPCVVAENSFLLGTAVGDGQGAKRLTLSKDGKGLKFSEAWSSRSPKPYFNDGVVHEGHYYGFDDRNFICLDLRNGRVKWNAGSRYGFGQVLLVKAQNALIVQAETGALALVAARPDEFDEWARLPALKDKTWNHPVLVRGRLFLRNGVEAVCYDVSQAAE